MHMTKLTNHILGFLILIIVAVVAYSIDGNDHYRVVPFIWATRSIITMLIPTYVLCISMGLKDVIALKYRTVKHSYYVDAEYLTLNMLCIPTWKPVEEDLHSYDCQNIFGATYSDWYSTSRHYKSVDDAVSAINSHKKYVIRKRAEWINKSTTAPTEIKYY